MAYIEATAAGVGMNEELLAQLTDSDAAPREVDWTIVADHVAAADDVIDRTLDGKYVTPLDVVDLIVKLWSRRIAQYLLFRNRPTMPMPATVKADYEQTLRDLEFAARGAEGVRLRATLRAGDDDPTPSRGAREEVIRRFGRGRDGLG